MLPSVAISEIKMSLQLNFDLDHIERAYCPLKWFI